MGTECQVHQSVPFGPKNSDSRFRPFAVIMKCAETCNYVCGYCYVEKHSAVPVMSIDTATAAIAMTLDYVKPGRKVNFIWHGGEPLLSGLDFFRSVTEFSARYTDNTIEHCIQTNGSMLNAATVECLHDLGFLISLSIDGPADIHDQHRRRGNGEPTHADVMRAARLLRDRTGGVGCVAVLHRGNVNEIERVYRFFREYRINFRVNPVVRSGRAADNYNELAITPKQYGEAMCRLFDLWFEDDGAIQVEPLHTILGNMVGPTVWGCDYHGQCLRSILSVNPDGAMYPCGRFAGLEEFRLGTVGEQSLEEVYNSTVFQELCKRSPRTVPGCEECEFVSICHTGCMITAHMARGNILDRDYYCRGRKTLFKHITEKLTEHLADVADRNKPDRRSA